MDKFTYLMYQVLSPLGRDPRPIPSRHVWSSSPGVSLSAHAPLASSPPSTVKHSPVMKELFGPERNTTASATSRGCPQRPRGERSVASSSAVMKLRFCKHHYLILQNNVHVQYIDTSLCTKEHTNCKYRYRCNKELSLQTTIN